MANTPNINLPLPDADTDLNVDVETVKAALVIIDTKIQELLTKTQEIVPSVSPAFSGVPTAPTAQVGANSQQLATVQFVADTIAHRFGLAPELMDTFTEIAAALGDDPNFAATMTTVLSTKVDQDAFDTALAALPVISVVTAVPDNSVGKNGDVFLIVDP